MHLYKDSGTPARRTTDIILNNYLKKCIFPYFDFLNFFTCFKQLIKQLFPKMKIGKHFLEHGKIFKQTKDNYNKISFFKQKNNVFYNYFVQRNHKS